MRVGLRKMKLRWKKEETREDTRWGDKGRSPVEARRKFRGRDDRKRNT